MNSRQKQQQLNKPRRDALVALFLVLFSVILYAEIYFWKAFGPEFPLYFFYSDGEDWRNVVNTYLDFTQGWYRPTASVPYWLVQKIADWHNLAVWRLANVITCGIAAWLVYLLSLELFPTRRLAAGIAAFYFLIHPDFYLVNFEVASFDFLHIIFALGTILFYLRSHKRLLFLIPSWLCFVGAVTSKEVSVALPGVLFLISAVHVWQKPAAERARSAAQEGLRLLPFLFVLPVYWYLHIRVMQRPGPGSPYSMEFHPTRMLVMLAHLALWGMRLFFVMGISEPDVFPANWLDHLLGLASIAVVVWQWKKLITDKPELRPQLAFLIGWYFLLLVIPAATSGFMRHTSLSVPAFSILAGVAFSRLLRSFPEPRRQWIIYASVALLCVFTLFGIHTELIAGTHSPAIRISEKLLDKPPVPPERLGNMATVFIDDRLNLGPWSYGCFGRLFNYVYKRHDITEVIVRPGESYPQEALAENRNSYFFRYNNDYDWYDASEEIRAAALKPVFTEAQPGQVITFDTNLKKYAKLTWSISPASAGTISSDGIYTAPRQIDQPLSVKVVAQSSERNPRTLASLVNLFPKWKDASIGGASGKHTSVGTMHTLLSDGDIWGTSDRFSFSYQTISGDGTWTGHVTQAEPAATPTKVGVMLRTSLAPNAPHLFAGLFSGSQAIVESRQYAGAETGAVFGALGYTFFRIERSGNQLQALTSPDGQHWVRMGSPLTLPLGPELLAGIAVSSGSGSAITAEFSQIRWEAGTPSQ